jgi:hypothetical protein
MPKSHEPPTPTSSRRHLIQAIGELLELSKAFQQSRECGQITAFTLACDYRPDLYQIVRDAPPAERDRALHLASNSLTPSPPARTATPPAYSQRQPAARCRRIASSEPGPWPLVE